MPRKVFGDGETVFLVDARGRRYLKTLRAGHRLTIRGTVVRADELIGADEGVLTSEAEPERFRAFRPSYAELVTTLERPAEPIFAKDAGAIIVRGDIRAGDRVIETGVGAGALTIALLRAVGPAGALAGYELRRDFADAARANVAAYYGPAPQWTLTVADARDGFEERDVDHVVVDLPEPVPVLDAIAASLRPGGTLVAYLPTILQVAALRDALATRSDLVLAETIELLERSWHIEGRSVRPDHRMIAHTGFLTFARRAAA